MKEGKYKGRKIRMCVDCCILNNVIITITRGPKLQVFGGDSLVFKLIFMIWVLLYDYLFDCFILFLALAIEL